MIYLLVAVAVLLLPVVSLALVSTLAKRPGNLGEHEGRLADCPGTPNCVCSQASDGAHRIEPISFAVEPGQAMERLKQVVTKMPRMRIVEERENYLRAEATSRLFRFVDDVEFLVEPRSKVIQVRSASRVGRSDLGVNRNRVEEIRKSLKGEE